MKDIGVINVNFYTKELKLYPSLCKRYEYDLNDDEEFQLVHTEASCYAAIMCESNPNMFCRIEKQIIRGE